MRVGAFPRFSIGVCLAYLLSVVARPSRPLFTELLSVGSAVAISVQLVGGILPNLFPALAQLIPRIISEWRYSCGFPMHADLFSCCACV